MFGWLAIGASWLNEDIGHDSLPKEMVLEHGREVECLGCRELAYTWSSLTALYSN